MKWYFWLFIGLGVVLLGLGAFLMIGRSFDKNLTSPTTSTQSASQSKQIPKLVFTHKIFDTDKVTNIVPLGELNGGYEELQTLNGVMVQLNSKLVKDSPINVYAPTDMELFSYARTATTDRPEGDWSLEFRISENYKLTIHHLNNADKKITDVVGNTSKENGSRGIDIHPPIKFKAGEQIGTTRGTGLANNWNVYVFDKNVENQFVNQARYEQGGHLGERLLTAACPFDYYQDQAIKEAYYALLGATKAGQAKTCGNPSKDIKGTLSGLWHLQPAGIETGYDGHFANPFSVYMRSDEAVIIYELGRKFYTIPKGAPSYKNPEEMTTTHCYNLADDWSGQNKSGYAFFRVDSDMEMSVAFSPTGSCPADFPSENAKKYYR